jgi:pyruvate dehydrogenase E1 component alpha subunit
MAMKYKGDKKASLVYMGDGATSEGDFHEAMNFAGVFKAPVVLICQNNQWAISVPLSRQTASETIAQKAVAYGFDGLRVDGNDVFAVFRTVSEAVEKARSGGGPTFIECVTYRMSDHTTADDAKKYRPGEDLDAWKKRDPIDRLRSYMKQKGIWTEAYEKSVTEAITKKIDADVREAEAMPAPEPTDMFDFLFESLPKELTEERSAMLAAEGK